MMETKNIPLQLFEGADKFDYKVINDNFEKIDNSLNPLNLKKYPTLTDEQKTQIRDLAMQYYNNRNLFYYNDDNVNRNTYVTNECYNADKSKFKLNCSSFAQFVYMGRSIEDFKNKNGDNYSNAINTDFDFGYYFEFANRKMSGIAKKDSKGNITGYYGFNQPHKNEDPNNYLSSYSFNTYYNKNSNNLYNQTFRSYMFASDMAFELYKMGCEIPRSELQVGDIVFVAAPINVDDNDSEFGDHVFKNITHVLIVRDVNSKGDVTFIDCTSAADSETMAITVFGADMVFDFDRVRTAYTDENIVFCARHPVAWGKNNMQNITQIGYLVAGDPDGLSNNPIPVNINLNGVMIDTIIIAGKYYIYNNKIGKAITSTTANVFTDKYFSDIR